MHFAIRTSIRKSLLPSLSQRLFLSPLSRLWNCAHEFEQPPAHVQVRVGTGCPSHHAPSNIPFCPMAPSRSFPLTVSSPWFCPPSLASDRVILKLSLVHWHTPTPVAPSFATSTYDRAYSVICGCFSFPLTKYNFPVSVLDTLRHPFATYYIRTANPGVHTKGTARADDASGRANYISCLSFVKFPRGGAGPFRRALLRLRDIQSHGYKDLGS